MHSDPILLEVRLTKMTARPSEVFDEVENRSVHLYADIVRAKWPDLTESQIDNVCEGHSLGHKMCFELCPINGA